MRHLTQALLDAARNEKDVENAYRGEIGHHRPDVGITSPFGSDGYAQWRDVRALLEFKYDLALKQHRDQCGVLGQMILYLKKFEQAGQVMPNVLFVGDKNECFALEVGAVKHFLALPIDWSAAPSAGEPALTRALLDGLAISPFVFDVGCDFRDVLDKIEVLAKGEVHRVKATQENIGAMFTFWEGNVFLPTSGLTSTEQVDVFLRCLFKPDDVVAHGANKNILVVEGRKIPVNGHQWQSFINHFVRGYKPSEIEGFYASKDRLIEDESRRRQGAFFTPTLWVAEAHKMLDAELGANWRETCIVWDCAAGTGNLTRDYNFGSLILSTLEQSDVDVIREQGYNPGANLFRYDFLNDDSSPFFTERNTLPPSVDKMLREAAKAGKRLVFLMNPPYGTANNAGTEEGDHKAGIALTAVNEEMKAAKIGASSQQLYAQFMYRSAKLAEQYGFDKHTVATYSVPTFMCSGSYKPFRTFWYGKFSYRGGMLFQASHFADVSGRWGVSFTLWSEGATDSKTDLLLALKDVKNFTVATTEHKHLYNSDGREASKWVREPTKGLKGVDAPQMAGGLRIKDAGRGTLASDALGFFNNNANNLMDSAGPVFLVSSCAAAANGFSFLPGDSFLRATALYAARKLVTEDWQNQKDEYLAPNTALPAYTQWNDDAVIYALLHTSNNCTAMRNVQYKGKPWRIRNHFFWRARADARVLYDTPSCGTLYHDVLGDSTDPYLAEILPALTLSPEAQECLTLLDTLLVTSLPQRDSFATSRPELHLMAWDAGVYQLKNLWRETDPNGWKSLQVAFRALSDKLRPGVFEFGFLR